MKHLISLLNLLKLFTPLRYCIFLSAVFEGTRVKAVTVESSIVALRGLKQTLRSAGVEVR